MSYGVSADGDVLLHSAKKSGVTTGTSPHCNQVALKGQLRALPSTIYQRFCTRS